MFAKSNNSARLAFGRVDAELFKQISHFQCFFKVILLIHIDRLHESTSREDNSVILVFRFSWRKKNDELDTAGDDKKESQSSSQDLPRRLDCLVNALDKFLAPAAKESAFSSNKK